MWICFNDGFISTVQNRDNPDMLVARARRKEHLANVFPDRVDEIFSLQNSDYRYRLNISKADYAKVVTDRIMAIDYDNFKNSVEDHDLHDMYLGVWHLGYNMQRRR